MGTIYGLVAQLKFRVLTARLIFGPQNGVRLYPLTNLKETKVCVILTSLPLLTIHISLTVGLSCSGNYCIDAAAFFSSLILSLLRNLKKTPAGGLFGTERSNFYLRALRLLTSSHPLDTW